MVMILYDDISLLYLNRKIILNQLAQEIFFSNFYSGSYLFIIRSEDNFPLNEKEFNRHCPFSTLTEKVILLI